jgi:hypothetical protein
MALLAVACAAVGACSRPEASTASLEPDGMLGGPDAAMSSRRLDEMTARERQELCEWSIAERGGEWTGFECGEYRLGVEGAPLCVDDTYALEGCGLSEADYRACVTATSRAPCDVNDDCAAVNACWPAAQIHASWQDSAHCVGVDAVVVEAINGADVYQDLFDCAAGSGTAADLPLGRFRVTVRLRDASNATLASSAPIDVQLTVAGGRYELPRVEL